MNDHTLYKTGSHASHDERAKAKIKLDKAQKHQKEFEKNKTWERIDHKTLRLKK
jgi:hypothetical protein